MIEKGEVFNSNDLVYGSVEKLEGRVFANAIAWNLSFNWENLEAAMNTFGPAILKVRELQGCVVECGVGFGRSALIIQTLLHFNNVDAPLYLLDSFEGFPEPTEEDSSISEFEDQIENEWAQKGRWNYVDTEHIGEILSASLGGYRNREGESNQVSIIKGFFEDTITEDLIEDIRANGGIKLMHLDADLYSSYKVCLERLWDLVVPGGIIILDESDKRSQLKWPGAKKAIREFFGSEEVKDRIESLVDLRGKEWIRKIS